MIAAVTKSYDVIGMGDIENFLYDCFEARISQLSRLLLSLCLTEN